MRKSLPTTVAVRVREEARYGRLPLLPEERDLGLLRAAAANLTVATSFWPLLIGTLLPHDGSLFSVLCFLMAGAFSGVTLSAIAALPSARYGIDAVDFAKCVFGQRGAKMFAFLFLTTATLEIQALAGLTTSLSEAAIIAYGIPLYIAVIPTFVAFYAAVAVSCVQGPLSASRLSYVVLPAVALILGLLAILGRQEWSACSESTPSAPTLFSGESRAWSYFSVGFALALKEWSQITAIFRHAATRPARLAPLFLILAPGLAAIAWLGFTLSKLTGFVSIGLWVKMLGNGSFLLLANLLMLMACVAASSSQLTMLTLSLRHFRAYRRFSWSQSIFALCVFELLVGIVIMAKGLSIILLLRTVGIALGCGLFVLCLNFCCVRGHRLDLSAIFDDAPRSRYRFQFGYQRSSLALWATLFVLHGLCLSCCSILTLSFRETFKMHSAATLCLSATYVSINRKSRHLEQEKSERRVWARVPRVLNL